MGGAVRRRRGKTARQNSSSSSSITGRSTGSSSAARHKNISLLLARGATARNLHPSLLQPLTSEEMEKDLRHMQAYANAVKSYQQQYYLQVHSHHPRENVQPLAVSLPVRIDPEEEKRLTNLRKKIARAEVIREEAEQHYVASRAHYVHTVKDLEKTSQERFHVIDFLQKLVTHRAAVVAVQRARLQMARDVRCSLQARIDALQQDENERRAAGAPPPPPFVPHLTGDDPLTTTWNQSEEEYRRAVAACLEKRKKPLLWPAAQLPSCPPGLPTLLSAAAVVPDKSVASLWSMENNGGTTDHKDKLSSLIWLDGHLPLDTRQEQADEAADVERLERQVELLEAELARERKANAAICTQINTTRVRNDEWTAVMQILRHETEAVLHRHNTILSSDKAVEAAQKLAEEANTTTTTTTTTTAPPAVADEANDGDDEAGSNNEEDEEVWNANKRAAEESQPEGSPRSKRPRRL